jgi:hypothetical protein
MPPNNPKNRSLLASSDPARQQKCNFVSVFDCNTPIRYGVRFALKKNATSRSQTLTTNSTENHRVSLFLRPYSMQSLVQWCTPIRQVQWPSIIFLGSSRISMTAAATNGALATPILQVVPPALSIARIVSHVLLAPFPEVFCASLPVAVCRRYWRRRHHRHRHRRQRHHRHRLRRYMCACLANFLRVGQ